MDARPQVIPVFVAGLCNSLPRQVARNWNREEVIRIHFGRVLDLSDYFAKPDRLRTHKEIADVVMAKIAELGEEDRLRLDGSTVQSSSFSLPPAKQQPKG
jgi:hypothetical protein